MKNLNGFIFNLLVLVLVTLVTVLSLSLIVVAAIAVDHYRYVGLMLLTPAFLGLAYVMGQLTKPKWPVY